jgi:hypothetical protein
MKYLKKINEKNKVYMNIFDARSFDRKSTRPPFLPQIPKN